MLPEVQKIGHTIDGSNINVYGICEHKNKIRMMRCLNIYISQLLFEEIPKQFNLFSIQTYSSNCIGVYEFTYR